MSNENMFELDELVQAYKACFSTSAGKVVLNDLKTRYGFERTTFDENHGRMAMKEGQRCVVLHCVYMIEEAAKMAAKE